MRRLPLVLVTCLALVCCTSPAVRGSAQELVTGPGPGSGPGSGPEAEPRTHSYGPLPQQRLVAYGNENPYRPGPRRTGVVIVHGGFWYQERSAGWDTWARRISGAGPAVFSLDYRRNTDASWPAQREDVLRALRWIRQRAGRFGVNPERIVLLGSSAGGQLVTGAGTYGAGRRHLAGVVALSPVVDPYRSWSKTSAHGRVRLGTALLRSNSARLAGCEPRSPRAAAREAERCRSVWRDMSATRHASGRDDPPMLLVHSRRDFVPVAHSEALREAELRHGMPRSDITVATVPGAAHGGGLLNRPGVERMVLSWIAARTRSSAREAGPSAPDGGPHG